MRNRFLEQRSPPERLSPMKQQQHKQITSLNSGSVAEWIKQPSSIPIFQYLDIVPHSWRRDSWGHPRLEYSLHLSYTLLQCLCKSPGIHCHHSWETPLRVSVRFHHFHRSPPRRQCCVCAWPCLKERLHLSVGQGWSKLHSCGFVVVALQSLGNLMGALSSRRSRCLGEVRQSHNWGAHSMSAGIQHTFHPPLLLFPYRFLVHISYSSCPGLLIKLVQLCFFFCRPQWLGACCSLFGILSRLLVESGGLEPHEDICSWTPILSGGELRAEVGISFTACLPCTYMWVLCCSPSGTGNFWGAFVSSAMENCCSSSDHGPSQFFFSSVPNITYNCSAFPARSLVDPYVTFVVQFPEHAF